MHKALLVLASSMALLTAACGGSAEDAPADNGSESKAATNSELAGKIPASIKDKGKLTVATDGTIGEPFASFASDNKTLAGLNIDVAKALGEVVGMEVELVNTPFGTFIPGLQAGRYDYSVSVMLDTKERQKVVDFVDYLKDGSGFLVREGETALTELTPETACGVKVGVIQGSVEQATFTEASKVCTGSGKPAVALSVFAENAQGILALRSERVDAWSGSSAQNAWIKSQNKGKLKTSGQVFNAAVDGIALLKNSELVPVLHEALQHLIDTGKYKEIFAKYGMEDAMVEKATLNQAVY